MTHKQQQQEEDETHVQSNSFGGVTSFERAIQSRINVRKRMLMITK